MQHIEEAVLRDIHSSIVAILGAEIVKGEHGRRSDTLGEEHLSRRFDVSRTAVREALRTLVSKGLLYRRRHLGTTVTPRDEWRLLDPDVIEWTLADDSSAALMADLYRFRMVIEPAAARAAAEGRTAKELSRMDLAVKTLKISGLHSDEGKEARREFHRSVLLASGNQIFASLAGPICALAPLRGDHKSSRRPARSLIPVYEKLFDAIAAADADAADAAMKCILDAGRFVDGGRACIQAGDAASATVDRLQGE